VVVGEVALQGPGLIEFAFLWQRTGSKAGGRPLFEDLVQDLVGLEHPDVATVEANPGDWGIDAFIGELVAGSVAVWQAKYFIDGFGTAQQRDVRNSYQAAQKAARENGYRLQAWTLCLPVSMDGPNFKWWSTWKKKTEKEDDVIIDLWHEVALRRRLLRGEARDVREFYFNPVFRVAGAEEAGEPLVQELLDPDRYDGALFVRQMEEADLPDCRAAREEFFNAEILTQEILDKGDNRETQALQLWSMALRSTWSHRFNDACQGTTTRRLPGLFGAVMSGVHTYHVNVPRFLRAAPIHGYGLVHQEVESGNAGWVRDWEAIAETHRFARRSDNDADADGTGLTGAPSDNTGEQTAE